MVLLTAIWLECSQLCVYNNLFLYSRTKGDKELKESEQIKFEVEDKTYRMILTSVNPSDAALYTVKAHNTAGSVSCSGRVKIQRMYSARHCYKYVINCINSDSSCYVPIFVVSPLDDTVDNKWLISLTAARRPSIQPRKMSDTLVPEDGQVTFECKVEGLPLPQVKW